MQWHTSASPSCASARESCPSISRTQLRTMQYKFPVQHVQNVSQTSRTLSVKLVMLTKIEGKFCRAETAFLVRVQDKIYSGYGLESFQLLWSKKSCVV